MAHQPTRRELLVQIAATTAASSALAPLPLRAQEAYQPQNSAPRSTNADDAGGRDSAAVGNARSGCRAASIASSTNRWRVRGASRTALEAGLRMLEKAGSDGMDESARVQLLTEYSQADDARGEFFRALKDMTIDAYYTTEIGLVQELGYQGNTYLREFPGCQDEEHP